VEGREGMEKSRLSQNSFSTFSDQVPEQEQGLLGCQIYHISAGVAYRRSSPK